MDLSKKTGKQNILKGETQMNIINTNKADMSKRDIYALTRGQSISLKDVENGAEITPDVWALYTDVNSKGNEVEILSVKDVSGNVFTTNSPTFKDEFAYIAELMSGEQYDIRVIKRESKAGRTFITCELV